MLTEKQKEIARQTAAETERVFAEMRRNRMESQMTGRIRKAWAQLDAAVDEVVKISKLLSDPNISPEDHQDFTRDLDLVKASAKGKSEILAILMPAPLNTPDAISAEAGKRYQMRTQGKKYETPGIRMVAATVMDDIVGDPEFT